MGFTDRDKKKAKKTSDRKFVFDWSNEEDTYKESELSLGTGRKAIGFLGRHIGGMDESLEERERAALYKSILQARGDSVAE